MEKINVLTGASGHIGAALIYRLGEKGEYVRALAFGQSDADFLKGRVDGIISGDVNDEKSLEKCFDGADVVYHLAGVITIGREDRKLLRRVNVDGRNRSKRPVKLRVGFLKAVAPLAELYYRMRRVKPLFTPYSLYTLTSNCNFDNSKARNELGFDPRSISESIADEYEFMRAVDPDAFSGAKRVKSSRRARAKSKKLKTAKATKRY